MKTLRKLIALSLCLVCGLFLFSGCKAKTYKLIGIIEEGDTEVTLLAQIEDESTKEYLVDAYECEMEIDLKSNGKFSMYYSVHDNDLTIDYTQTGKYEINDENKTITFFTKRSDGTYRENLQQYENGMIIYFDGVVHLVFK